MMVILAMTMVFTLGGNPPSDFKPGLYGTAQSLNQLVRINPNGTWSTVLSVVDLPNGLAFRDSNTVYVTADGPNWPSPSAPMVAYQSDGSVVFTVNIPVTNQWPNGSAGTGLAFDAQGNAYVATWNSPGATKVTPNGVASDWTGYVYGLWWGRDAKFSPTGELYTIQGLDYGPGSGSTGNVAKIDPVTGAVTFVLTGITVPQGIAFDKKGNMYLSLSDLNTIVKVPAGTTTPIPFANLSNPNKLAVGHDGKLYALTNPADLPQQEIWKIDLNNGSMSLFASDLPYLTDIAFLHHRHDGK